MKAPAFQFYAADFLVGTAMMSAEEVGGYIRLLCYQWTHGSIPNDDAVLQRLTGCGGNAVASIRHKFGIGSAGGLVNERLERVRQDSINYRAKQAENATKGWEKRNKTRVGNAKPDAVAMPTHMPNGCSSVSSLQSSSSSLHTLRPAVAVDAPVEPKPTKERKPRPRNPHFDALASIETANPERLNDSEAGKIAKALSLIRQSSPEVTPEEIKRRAANYATHYPTITQTALGLAKNWSVAEKEKPEDQGKPKPREMYGNDYFARRDEIEAQKEREFQARLAREKAAHEAAFAGAAEVCADLLKDDPEQ